MTKQEAKIFFTVADGDDPIDIWEMLLFEVKHFFLTRPVISSVVHAKLNRLKKQYEAFSILFPSDCPTENAVRKKQDSFNFEPCSNDLILAYKWHSKWMNELKQELQSAGGLVSLSVVLSDMLLLEKHYRKLWYFKPAVDLFNENVVLSKAPDPMEVLKALNTIQIQYNSPVSLVLMTDNWNSLSTFIQREVKRLTLLQDLEDVREIQ